MMALQASGRLQWPLLGGTTLCCSGPLFSESPEVLGTRGFPGGSDRKESAYGVGDTGSIPGLGRSPGEGNGNPLQYSCLENPMDRGAWRDTVHGVAKRQIWLSTWHFSLSEVSGMRVKPESMCMHYMVHTLDIHPRAPAVLRDLESNPVPGTHKPSAELVQWLHDQTRTALLWHQTYLFLGALLFGASQVTQW